VGDSTVNFRADQINETWLGWPLTVRNRVDAVTVTGYLSDFEFDPEHDAVWLYMGGRVVELRSADTITHDGLGLMGGAL
jgi:hypothetical protein